MKTKVLIYCTKAKPYLGYWVNTTSGSMVKIKNIFVLDNYNHDNLNGKIVAECEVECEEMKNYGSFFRVGDLAHTIEVARKSCLNFIDMHNYLGTKDGYALHIGNLKIFDKPLRLIEVEHKKVIWGNEIGFALEKAPQNMMWVWYKGERYCLISIRPKWVCKIINGEKTIEVRKKVLKGML